ATVLLALSACRPAEKPAAASDAGDRSFYRQVPDAPERTAFALDFAGIDKPAGPEEFPSLYHTPPVPQGRTSTCWSFATTSLFESELKRLYGLDVKLSEMHTAYWEFVEKARAFIRAKGDSALREGSEPEAVVLRMKTYGAVRASDYTGLVGGATAHDHTELHAALWACLEGFRDRAEWDEAKAVAAVRAILDKQMGAPPETIEVDGRRLTPKEYLDEVLRLPLDAYVAFVSFKYLPFYAKGEYRVPDNWWRGADYYNVPLGEFTAALAGALAKGFTVALAGDISEVGNSGPEDIAVVPSFDIPRALIGQDAREFRFANRTTTDDHVLHLVGTVERPGGRWFLLKDSWETAWQGGHKGYFFYREDYVKLKMLTFFVHRDAVAELLAKF
ncbi:MAG: peptidase C1, partial [Candidatus Aminicenantes bacterium]|nr:peptidase C1 [Candidatus Aminicenantes bacterium]